MTILRVVVGAIALSAALLVAAPTASACSCAPPPRDEVAVGQADAVFSGRVVDSAGPVFLSRRSNGYALAVEEAYKGTVYEKQWVFTESQSSACGTHLKFGHRYIVFAYGEDPHDLNTSSCSKTRTIEDRPELGIAGVVLPGRSRGTPPSPLLALLTVAAGIAAYRLGIKHREHSEASGKESLVDT